MGEGVNDYGGPYRAVFDQVIDELQSDELALSTASEPTKSNAAGGRYGSDDGAVSPSIWGAGVEGARGGASAGARASAVSPACVACDRIRPGTTWVRAHMCVWGGSISTYRKEGGVYIEQEPI